MPQPASVRLDASLGPELTHYDAAVGSAALDDWSGRRIKLGPSIWRSRIAAVRNKTYSFGAIHLPRSALTGNGQPRNQYFGPWLGKRKALSNLQRVIFPASNTPPSPLPEPVALRLCGASQCPYCAFEVQLAELGLGHHAMKIAPGCRAEVFPALG